MYIYILLLVASVFLGSQILAIPTPVAQVTLYRLLAIGVVPLLMVQLMQSNSRLKIIPHSHASKAIYFFTGWWCIAVVSGAWAQDLKLWFQAIFLMTIGLSSIYAIYFWLNNFRDWIRLIQIAWGMMTGLMVWGYLEIITNKYLLADLTKLDKYGTFVSQPMTRIPITIFANQNDYATMLIAYLCLSMILFSLTRLKFLKVILPINMLLSIYLIYRSQSRMSLLCSLIFIAIIIIQQFKLDFSRKGIQKMILTAFTLGILLVLVKPSLITKVTSLYYRGGTGTISGDVGRINLWRMGFVFLSQTFGFGVGAGNIEHWMELYGYLPTNGIVNIHNWWLEILVGYGWFAFVFYVLAYILLMYRLVQISRSINSRYSKVAKYLYAFLTVFVAASVTSANNMLIEWHWVFFALIIGFVKLAEINSQKFSPEIYDNQRKVCV